MKTIHYLKGEGAMKFGYFDDANREYVITTPKTPLPWINYLGCNDFFSLISNTCGGYTFYKDAKLLRLTRYRYNDVPADINGKYIYIKDGDNWYLSNRLDLPEEEYKLTAWYDDTAQSGGCVRVLVAEK